MSLSVFCEDCGLKLKTDHITQEDITDMRAGRLRIRVPCRNCSIDLRRVEGCKFVEVKV